MSPTRAPRHVSGPQVVTGWIITRALIVAGWLLGSPGIQGDVYYYLQQLLMLPASGPAGVLIEYPTPVIWLLSVPQWLSFGNPDVYVGVFIAAMLILDGCFALSLWRRSPIVDGRPRRRAVVWWVVFGLVMGPTSYMRFDMLTAVLAGWALLNLRDRRPGIAGVLIGIGAAIKLWPALLFFALLGRKENRGRASVGFLATGVGLAVTSLLYGGWDRLISPLTWQSDRGLQIESVWATWPMIARAAGGPYEVWRSRYNAFEVFGDVRAWTSAATVATVVGGVLIVGAAVWFLVSKAARDLAVAGVLMLFITTVMIITNKTFSPQYLIWLGPPMAAVLLMERKSDETPAAWRPELRRISVVIAILAALTQVIYPFGYGHLVEATPFTTTVTAILTVRNLGMFYLVGWLAATLARRCASREPALAEHGPATQTSGKPHRTG